LTPRRMTPRYGEGERATAMRLPPVRYSGQPAPLPVRDEYAPLAATEEQPERQCGIALPLLPRNDGVADVTQTMRRQRRGSPLPAKADAAAELPVPEPPPIAGKARDGRAVRQRDRADVRFPIHHAFEKGPRIAAQSLELFGCGDLAAHVVRGPSAHQSRLVAFDVVLRRRNEFHGDARVA